jgi:hypothetical protein
MIQEAIEYLMERGEQAASAKVIEVDGAPPHMLLIQRGDELRWEEAKPFPRKHAARDMSAIIEFAEQSAGRVRAKDDADDEGSDDDCDIVGTINFARVWYDREGVSVILDDKTRRDSIRLPLVLSDQIKTLQQMATSRAAMKQRDLILLLRTTFAGCLGPAGNFLEVIRKLKFVNNQSGEVTIGTGKISVGRQVEMEVTGSSIIPEAITLQVPVFTNGFTFLHNVQVVVDVDPATETLRLIPPAQEIERAIVAAEAEIGRTLREHLGDLATVAVHFGAA